MNRAWSADSDPSMVSERKPPPPASRWVLWLGLAVVLAAAAVLSFAALRDLALVVRIHPELAWLLPIAIDAGAAVSCAVWLSGNVPPDASKFARSMTWGLLLLTIAGNAGSLGMAANNITAPWWTSVLVGAVPPLIVGGVVHLSVLVGRADRTESTNRTDSRAELPDRTAPAAPAEPAEPPDVPELPEIPDLPDEEPEVPDIAARTDGELLDDLRALADQTGRRPGRNVVARELGVGATRATRLLDEFDRTGPRRTA